MKIYIRSASSREERKYRTTYEMYYDMFRGLDVDALTSMMVSIQKSLNLTHQELIQLNKLADEHDDDDYCFRHIYDDHPDLANARKCEALAMLDAGYQIAETHDEPGFYEEFEDMLKQKGFKFDR